MTPTWAAELPTYIQGEDLVVPPGRYFAMGDNRTVSLDGRYWGFVPRANVVGLPFIIYFSLHQPSATDDSPLPDDRLGHEKSPLDTVMEFARWSRTFRVIH